MSMWTPTPEQSNRRTVDQLLEDQANSEPNALLLRIPGGDDFSRGDVLNRSQQVASALLDDGIMPGDCVAMMVGNSAEFVFAWFGALLIGAIPAPLHASFKGDILANLLMAMKPTALLIDDEIVNAAAPALSEIGFDGLVVQIGDSVTDIAGPVSWSRTVRFAEWTNREPIMQPRRNRLSDICTILYSSGTTGPSKGALWPHKAMYALAADWAMIGKYGPGDIVYTATPLFHGLALSHGVLGALVSGGACALAPRFSASRFWSDCAATKATKTALLGEMATHLWNQPPSEIERQHDIDAAFLAPRPADTFDAFEKRFNLKVYGGLGTSDVGGMTMWAGQDEGNPKAIGRPSPYWETMLVDDFDEPVPVGEPGELVARPRESSLGTQGYVGMPEASLAILRNCWYHTGDVLRADSNGWHYFVDRKKDSMRRGGENISTFEVEQCLLGHPDVLGACVFAVPSELSEDDVMATLVLREGAAVTEVGDYAEDRLPYFAVPRYYDVVDSMPLTATGKIIKSELKLRGITPTTWDRGRTRRTARS